MHDTSPYSADAVSRLKCGDCPQPGLVLRRILDDLDRGEACRTGADYADVPPELVLLLELFYHLVVERTKIIPSVSRARLCEKQVLCTSAWNFHR